eukprot:TRINITY_DN6090_c0_g3_i1.p1 TRINITY_DN6090_c0_g3~~TRINITY_DN6090_c0_g3_i1.p1  ORF type:complete len:345 (-),score=43.17 TRINITY_DN6090_c0_g3_i1:224-1258(-)
MKEHRPKTECRICLELYPEEDLIHACGCEGNLRYAHRECLDQWRVMSPHPTATTTCELCKKNFTFQQVKEDDCTDDFGRRTKYIAAVSLDILIFLAMFAGLYLLCGYLGDLWFTNMVKSAVKCDNTTNSYGDSTPCIVHMSFLKNTLFEGRIWFWGFVVFFFFLGIIACILNCCCECSSASNYDVHDYRSHHHNTYCWWVWCGPSYYNGAIYYTPYGYWGNPDFCCCVGLHHHSFHGGGNSNCDCGDSKEGAMILLIILLVVVAIFVVIGVIFGAIMTVLFILKIIRRHLHLLERSHQVKKYVLVDLDTFQGEVFNLPVLEDFSTPVTIPLSDQGGEKEKFFRP